MPDPFVLEKIRTAAGETEPYEVVAGSVDGTVTFTNFDEGTVRTIEPDGTETVEEIPDAGN